MSDLAERKMRFLYALRPKGVTDTRVLTAMERIDRGAFVTGIFAERAYEDMPLPIACGQTISQPSVVALMTQALDPTPRDKVLEIGTGSGYQAAVLHQLGARVFTVERQKLLYQKSKAFLKDLGYSRIRCFYKDGMLGLETFAPFDRIIVTAAAEDVPQPLLDQLTIGGILVIPVGDETQEMRRITRLDDQRFRTETFGTYRFVPFLGGLDAS